MKTCETRFAKLDKKLQRIATSCDGGTEQKAIEKAKEVYRLKAEAINWLTIGELGGIIDSGCCPLCEYALFTGKICPLVKRSCAGGSCSYEWKRLSNAVDMYQGSSLVIEHDKVIAAFAALHDKIMAL